jgi:predicted O-methyltransferase YrrM
VVLLTQTQRVINVIGFATNFEYRRTFLRKILGRVSELGRNESTPARRWASANSTSLEQWLSSLDSTLWKNAVDASTIIRKNSAVTISELESQGIDLGGAGSLELIYFWTRLIQPVNVLETGVAAGWSSYAFLSALEENGHGNLLSSDFPYFRIKNPEKYIGILVPDHLRNDNWRIEINGDDLNLPILLGSEAKLQLVHYDSDKRKLARKSFLKKIELYLDHDCVLIMDDIQNDLAFKEFAEYHNHVFTVIESQSKFVGVIFLGKYREVALQKCAH